jgi:TonB family protein
MFIDGKNHGRSVFYYNDGLEETKYDNKDDKIVGEYISYFPNSKVYAKAQFVNGNVVGKAQRYYQNEYILTDIEIDNQGNGIGIHYNEDGTIKEKVYFVGGFRRDASVVENEKKSKNEDVFRFNDVTNFFFEEFFYYDTDRVFFEIPTKDAEFKGGSYEMQKWIANNVRYPQKAIDNNVSNKVYVSFIVEANGSISTINIEEGYKIFQEEVIRLIESMPNWIPGEYNGKKVRVKCRLPINFKLY